jgi:predicted O-methyltransferase YrrM
MARAVALAAWRVVADSPEVAVRAVVRSRSECGGKQQIPCGNDTQEKQQQLQRKIRMLAENHRREITRLWERKVAQDDAHLPTVVRHRNLHPDSAELLHALAVGLRTQRAVEIGGSSGISTIALAAAMHATGGTLISLEIEPERQAESKETIARLGLSAQVDYRLGDAGAALPQIADVDLALLDCEKEDYVRFFDRLRMRKGGLVLADNVLSHHLSDYIAHVRAVPGAESVTLAVGQGLEITRFP